MTGRIFPNIDSDIANGTINQTYRTLNADEFPTNVSGTVGAIAIGAGTDSGFYGSFQNRPFIPDIPGDVGGGTLPDPTGGGNTPVITGGGNTPVVTDNGNVANNPQPDDNSDRLNRPFTDPDLKAQNNNSNTLRIANNSGTILKVDLFHMPANCHVNGMKKNQDGTPEFTHACDSKPNEQLQNKP